MLKNLGQLSKTSAELRRIQGETEFRDGEHGLTLILLEITVGGGTWKKGDYPKRELYMGVSKDICSEGLRAKKAEILTWLERLFS